MAMLNNQMVYYTMCTQAGEPTEKYTNSTRSHDHPEKSRNVCR